MPNGNGNGTVKFSSLYTSDDIICQTSTTDRDTVIMDLLKKLAMRHALPAFRDV